MKVLICDKIAETGVQKLKDAGHEVTIKTGMSPDELAAFIEPYHAVIVRSATKVRKVAIDAGKNLKAIGRGGVGLDNIDVEDARAKGIAVVNTPGASAISVAELAVGMALSLTRNIAIADASMKAGQWEKKAFMGGELHGKTLGVVATGQIGLHVIKIAKGFGMDVVAFDVMKNEKAAKELGFTYVEMEDLLAKSDIITLHCPLLPATKYLINKDTIAKMKDGALLIDCARGGVVCEADLVEALNSGKLGGAAVDVYEKEPTDNKALLAAKNVVLTPHLGASSREGQVRVGIDIAERIIEALK